MMGALLRAELLTHMWRQQDVWVVVAFFLAMASLFPLAIGAQAELLRQIAPGVVWVCALLASLLALPRLFADDHRAGLLEQWLLLPQSLSVLVLLKVLAHWLWAGLPLVLLSPLLGLQYGLQGAELLWLPATLLPGTLLLALIGGIGAALTLGARGGGALLALLIIPLCIPVLILGAGCLREVLAGADPAAWYYLLLALLLLVLPLAPVATAGALRITVD